MVRCFLQFSKLFGKLLESHPIFLSCLQVLTPVPYVTYHCRSCMTYAEVKITSKSLFVVNSGTALAFCQSCCFPRQTTGGIWRIQGLERRPSFLVFVFSCMNILLSRAKVSRDPKYLEGFSCSHHSHCQSLVKQSKKLPIYFCITEES